MLRCNITTVLQFLDQDDREFLTATLQCIRLLQVQCYNRVPVSQWKLHCMGWGWGKIYGIGWDRDRDRYMGWGGVGWGRG